MNQVITASLFLFAHQDDEFAVYHQIANDIQRGNRVICVYFTDGGKEALRRNTESIRSLSKLGVSPEQVIFQGLQLGVKDGELVNYLDELTNWFLPYLRSFVDIHRIYIPAWEGGHPDHDALHVLTCLITCKLDLIDSVRQFSLYNAYKCRAPFFRVMHPLSSNGLVEHTSIAIVGRIKYIFMCLGYPSQIKTWVGLFPFVTYSYLFIGKQSLQKVSIDRLCTKPHEGQLYYEMRRFTTWNDMRAIFDRYYLRFGIN